MHGSEIIKKDVLEYVVFEKHLANLYGTWRMHAKIIPDWMPPREFAERTLLAPPEKPPQEPEKLPTTPPVVSTEVKDAPASAVA